MRTYPILKGEKLHAFEITSTWIRFQPLRALIGSVSGVSHVARQHFSDNRICFRFQNTPMVVNEPFGDNSRYWIGCAVSDQCDEIDLHPLKRAFDEYHGFTLLNP